MKQCAHIKPAAAADTQLMLAMRRVLDDVANPTFVTAEDGLRDINVTIGDPVTLSCKTHGRPPPMIRWYRNGLPLDGNTLTCRLSSSVVIKTFFDPNQDDTTAWLSRTHPTLCVRKKRANLFLLCVS